MFTFPYRKIFFPALVLALCALSLNPIRPARARAAGPWNPLAGIIRQQLNPGNQPAGEVSLVQGNVAIIRLFAPLPIGTTLAVKGNSLPGVPPALQDNIARIKLTQVAGLQARGTILPGSRPVPPKTPLFPLGHNRVYLYTNLAAPQNLRPFQDLVRTLQANRIVYAMKNAAQLAAGDVPGIRPLIIAFEASGNRITCRLSDREQNVFYENSFALAFAPPTLQPAGLAFAPQLSAGRAPSTSISGNTSFTQARGPAPGTTAVGRIKLKNPYTRLVFTNYDDKSGQELALLNDQWIEVYRLDGFKLKPISRLPLPHKGMIPLNLHAGDFNHNGRDELYITLARPIITDDKQDSMLSSIIVEDRGGALKIVDKKLPYYFRVIEIRDGRRVLMAQKMGTYEQYKEPIYWGGFFHGKFALGAQFKQAKNIFSLYNFNFNPFNKNQILVLDEQGNLAGFNAKTAETLVYANDHYGIFDETPYNQKLKDVVYEGGFTITQTAAIRYAARRFIKRNSYGQQIFLIKKRREVHPDLKAKALAIVTEDKVKADQVIGLQWRGDEIIETWKSPPFPRDVIDFGFTKLDGRETMVIMTRNQAGNYALEMLH